MSVTLHVGDCREAIASMPDASVDSIVTDPPYELGFMGKSWDSSGIAYDAAMWAECLRVLKPGGHLLAFGGTRTYHRMTVAIEDAGFEIRDSIHWIYGSGFPKSLDVSKAIDKVRSEDREPVDAVRRWLNERRLEAGYSHDAVNKHFGHASNGGGSSSAWMTNPTSKSLPTWDQWRALKSLFGFGDEMDAEVWRLNGNKGKPGQAFQSREVLETRDVQDIRNGHGRTYGSAMFAGEDTGKIEHKITAPATPEAAAWSGWGTALKPAHEPIVVARKPLVGTVAANVLAHGTGALNIDGCRVGDGGQLKWEQPRDMGYHGGSDAGSVPATSSPVGRWPANVIFDEDAAAELDAQSGISASKRADRGAGKGETGTFGVYGDNAERVRGHDDSGGASRFFYCAKAGAKERPVGPDGTKHATVKPLALMRWLVRLVTPPGGTVLDPFAGSGTTLEAAILEGFDAVGIERDPAHADLCAVRVERSGGEWAVPKGWAA